jgi:hypothetical protein
MANFDMNLFGDENLKISEINDRMVAMQRQMNYQMRNLDSLNVKRLNTEITIIKSEGGEMDLTGRNIKMYDESSVLRFRVGLSTSGIYDMTMWSSDAATTDYDASSNASMFINSSGEVEFADKIKTKKNAEVGDNLYVGVEYTSAVTRAIRLRSIQQTSLGSTLPSGNVDMVQRTWFYGSSLANYQIGEFGSLPSTTLSNSSVMYPLFYTFFNSIGYEQVGSFFTFSESSARIQQVGYLAIAAFSGATGGNIELYAQEMININNYVNSTGVIMHINSFLGDTGSTSGIATVGFGNDNYCVNNSTDRKITWDYDSVNANGEMYVNTVLQIRPIDKAKTVQNLSTDRPVIMDYTTGAADEWLFVNIDSTRKNIMLSASTARKMSMDYTTGRAVKLFQNSTLAASLVQAINSTRVIQMDFTTALDNFKLFRNSTVIASAVLAKTTNAVKFDWVTASSVLQLDVDGINVANLLDRHSIVRNVSTDRRVDFGYTTEHNNLTAGRNSTTINSVILAETTNAHKLTWSTVNEEATLKFDSTTVATFKDKSYFTQNASTDRQVILDVSTESGGLSYSMNSSGRYVITAVAGDTNMYSFEYSTNLTPKLQRNGIIVANLAKIQNSTRALIFDFTTEHNNLTISRNTTYLESAVLSNSTQAYKINWSSAVNELDITLNSTNIMNLVDGDICVKNLSTDRQITLEFTTAHNNLNFYRNSTFQKSAVVTNTTNNLEIESTAMGSGQMLRIKRGSSQITQPVMDYTTGLNVQMHVRRLTSTEAFFPSTGVWLVMYSSGTYMGKTLLSA